MLLVVYIPLDQLENVLKIGIHCILLMFRDCITVYDILVVSEINVSCSVMIGRFDVLFRFG